MPPSSSPPRARAGGAIFASVHALVRRIPAGKVATYGQLSALLDGRLTPVGIGWALRAGPEGLPWHRVVSARGTISTEGDTPGLQRALLLGEGIELDSDGRIDLARHQWKPRARRRGPGILR